MPKYNYPGYGPTSQNWLTARPGTNGGYHGGNDNAAKAGTPVYAQHSGEIFRSGLINGYGMAVVVKSKAPNGTVFYQLYGHLGPDPLPVPGTPVAADQPIPGAVIGTKEYVQATGGITSGPHLHREIISGKAKPKQTGPFGLFSSDITYKADPDTFDINNPVFPYENEEPKPPPQPSLATSSPRSAPIQPSLPGNPSASSSSPPTSTLPLLSPGMAIPNAEGPTSIGGPNGPSLLMLPARPQGPASLAPEADPVLPLLHFAPEAPQRFGPFTVTDPSLSPAPDHVSEPQPAEIAAAPMRRVSTMFPKAGPLGSNFPASPSAAPFGVLGGQPNATSRPPMSFPLEALLAPDRNRALDEWASSKLRGNGGLSVPSLPTPNLPASNLPAPSVFDQRTAPVSYTQDAAQDAPGGLLGRLMRMSAFDPSDPDPPPAGGLLALIQQSIRNNPDGSATR